MSVYLKVDIGNLYAHGRSVIGLSTRPDAFLTKCEMSFLYTDKKQKSICTGKAYIVYMCSIPKGNLEYYTRNF